MAAFSDMLRKFVKRDLTYVTSTYSMTIDIEKKERQLANELNKFSGKFMSNSKWTKVFEKLSQNIDIINKCLMKDVHDELLRQIYLPTFENVSFTFHDKGFKDYGGNQPYRFKEIQWIEFPSHWTIKSQKYKQDILKIKNQLHNIGQLEIECDEEKLIIYGYK